MKCFPGSQFSHLFNDSSRFDVLPWWLSGLESACSSGAAGDVGLIPESGRSPGEWVGYLLQYSWASLVAQTVNNQPEMRET